MAAASGWWAARYSHRKTNAGSRAALNSAYGQGLNYLLNEQPDKATEVLVQMLEVDPDTVELHLALGSLFRRRGEVDRAIRVHENVMARASLSEDLRAQASLELGRDFLKAGLLDRAEQLFTRMLAKGRYEKDVCRHLADVYQQVREWEKAIEIGRRLARIDDCGGWRIRTAHYACELGEQALQQRDLERALKCANQALEDDPGCVRATLLRGRCYEAQGDFRAAVDTYRQVQEQDASLIPEAADALNRCRAALGEPAASRAGSESGTTGVGDGIAVAATGRSAAREARYRCEACGFSSRKLFWQCPGCRDWSTVKPITAGNAQ